MPRKDAKKVEEPKAQEEPKKGITSKVEPDEAEVMDLGLSSTKEVPMPAKSMEQAQKVAAKAMGIKGFDEIIAEKEYPDEFVFVAEYVTYNKKGNPFNHHSKFKVPKI